MMLPISVLLVCLAVACGRSSTPYFEPVVSCNTWLGTWHYQYPISCSRPRYYAAQAEISLREAGLPIERFRGRGIWVYDREAFDGCPTCDEAEVKGLYDFRTMDVLLARCPRALVHELLHFYDEIWLGAGAAESASHASWQRPGLRFREVDVSFTYNAEAFWCTQDS